MERELKLLNRIKKFVNPNDFYVITIWEDKLQFQGHYTSKKVLKYSKLLRCNSINVNKNGYIEMSRSISNMYIEITLS